MGTLCATVYETGAGHALLLAAALTTIAFVSLTLFTMQSKVDWSFLGAGLWAALMVLCLGSLLSMFLGWQSSLPLSLLGCAVFCGYIIFDTYRISKHYSYDEYILAAIDLYLDILNLYV